MLFQTLQFQGCLGPYCEMTAEFSIIQTPFCLKWCLLLVWPQFAGVPAHSVGICQSQNSLPFTNNKTLQKVRYKLQKHLQPETPSRFRKSSMMPRIFNWLSDIYTPTCCNPLLGRTTLYLLRWVFRTKGRIQGASRIPARKHGILRSGALKAVHEIESDFLLEGLNPGSLRLVSCSLSWLFSLGANFGAITIPYWPMDIIGYPFQTDVPCEFFSGSSWRLPALNYQKQNAVPLPASQDLDRSGTQLDGWMDDMSLEYDTKVTQDATFMEITTFNIITYNVKREHIYSAGLEILYSICLL